MENRDNHFPAPPKDKTTSVSLQFSSNQRRTKSMVGNVFMLAVTAPVGYFLAGVVGISFWGLIAAVVASYIERYEFGPIDDNVLITPRFSDSHLKRKCLLCYNVVVD